MLTKEEQDQLILDNQKLVKHIVSKDFFKPENGIEFDDLMSEGNIGLIEAVRKYSGDIDEFPRYASRAISNQIIDYLRSLPIPIKSLDYQYENEKEGLGNLTTLYEITESEEFLDPEQFLHSKELKLLLKKYLDKLTALEREILTRNYGLDEREPESIRDIAKRKGMSKSGVYTISTRALNRLRQYFTIA